MDILEKKEHYIILFDFYENLLTLKQREYFKDYYFTDMSLAEIANEKGISRNAVFDQLKKIYVLLDEYEEKLSLFKKYEQRENVYEELETINDEKIRSLIEKLKNIE